MVSASIFEYDTAQTQLDMWIASAIVENTLLCFDSFLRTRFGDIWEAND